MAELPSPSIKSELDARKSALEHLSPAEAERLAQAVMRRQFALSAQIAVIFLALIFALPIINWLAPGLASANVAGFTLTWLFLGVLFYPITWLLSAWFVRSSNAIETAIAKEHSGEMGADL